MTRIRIKCAAKPGVVFESPSLQCKPSPASFIRDRDYVKTRVRAFEVGITLEECARTNDDKFAPFSLESHHVKLVDMQHQARKS